MKIVIVRTEPKMIPDNYPSYIESRFDRELAQVLIDSNHLPESIHIDKVNYEFRKYKFEGCPEPIIYAIEDKHFLKAIDDAWNGSILNSTIFRRLRKMNFLERLIFVFKNEFPDDIRGLRC